MDRMITTADVKTMIGATVLDRDDDRIGEIRQVFLEPESEKPTWVGVRIGLLGTEVLVPLEGADWTESALHADVSRSIARTAPAVDLDEPLSAEEEDRLLRHYGIPRSCPLREELDLAAYDDEPVSYSVSDAESQTPLSGSGR